LSVVNFFSYVIDMEYVAFDDIATFIGKNNDKELLEPVIANNTDRVFAIVCTFNEIDIQIEST
jgi:hypothetical protein